MVFSFQQLVFYYQKLEREERTNYNYRPCHHMIMMVLAYAYS